MEWRPNFIRGKGENKTALIQLSSATSCLLIQICATGISSALRQLLENESLKKSGVGINGDVAKLKRDFDICMKGIVDLNQMTKARMLLPGGGLRGLVKSLLGKDLLKPKNLRYKRL